MATTNFSIHPETRIGPLALTVSSLASMIPFYQEALGFQVKGQKGSRVTLGTSREDILELVEDPTASRQSRTTGLYHFALMLPSRKELARAVARLYQLHYPNYPTDHVISKSTYLDDPEGNNIELYIESAEDGKLVSEDGRLLIRRSDGRLSGGRDPLDLDALFGELSPGDNLDEPLPVETTMGHVHLYSSDLQESMHFYSDILGFKPRVADEDFGMGDVGLDRPHIIAFNKFFRSSSDISP